jgi:hypothetical protein
VTLEWMPETDHGVVLRCRYGDAEEGERVPAGPVTDR